MTPTLMGISQDLRYPGLVIEFIAVVGGRYVPDFKSEATLLVTDL